MGTGSKGRETSTATCLNRRGFFCGCAGCAGYTAALSGLAAPARLLAASATKVKVRVVFCETTNDKPIWPNIGYDFDARRKQVLDALTKGCSGLELLPVRVMDKPEDVATVLKDDAAVDGYIVCVQGLGWRNDLFQLCNTGKPSLLVDNLFGGSGKFLTQIKQIMTSDRPVDWVSSSNDADIVASARHLAMLGQGRSAADVAAAFRAERRQRTPTDGDFACSADAVPQPNFAEVMRELSRVRVLVVGGGWGGERYRKEVGEATGVQLIGIDFGEMAQAYEQADAEAGKAFADRWIKQAQKVVEPDTDEIEKSGRMYEAMKLLMAKHGAQGISINCLGGFYGGHLRAFPCLGFSQLNNDGLVGGCEADQRSATTMAIMGTAFHRPGFISDPVIDTSRNHAVYAHCVAFTKPFGPDGPSNPYLIRDHSEDRKGAAVQSLLPAGYMTTTVEIDAPTRTILVHQAKTDGNNSSDMACRTKLNGIVKGDIEKLTENWTMGWHRVTFYGDLLEPVKELAERLKMRLVEEA